MFEGPGIWIAISAAFVVAASPGPSTLAIAGTSMSGGRRAGLAMVAGITLGSWTWSTAAAFGLSAVMLTNVWIFDTMRFAGGLYLSYLAIKALIAAWKGTPIEPPNDKSVSSLRRAFIRGLMIHLTNPKVILLFGSLYAVALSHEASTYTLIFLVLTIGFQSMMIFITYALIFSSSPVTRAYMSLSRIFNTAIGGFFGLMALQLFRTDELN
jgi:threonine/homoserine/homoserine lactone efflux protein